MRNPIATRLLPVEEATKIILAHPLDLGEEQVPLTQALGRVLAEDLCADRDFPPFDRVTMDGIAIQFAAFEGGQRLFPVAGMQAAGQAQCRLSGADQCIEVMTGAILPEGTDTVIRYEDVQIGPEGARVTIEDIAFRQNIHRRGTDRRQGAVIVPGGRLLSPGEIGVAATVGKAHLQVRRLPKVVIISTGDELVEVHQTPQLHQIRTSNAYTLSAVLDKLGIQAVRLHFPDDKELIRSGLAECLELYDVVMLSGGVSEGEFDFVPTALEALGVEKFFHKVQQRPGKPFWFGQYKGRCAIFALPGNPVSCFMCVQRYFRPWLRQSLGLPSEKTVCAALSEPVIFQPQLTYFLPVQLEFSAEGRLLAYPVPGSGSGDLANLADTDAFLELPADRTHFSAGEVFPAITYR